MDKIKEAVKFHGHLGPYLILGVLAGEIALKRIGVKKYFGLEVKVYGANQKPKSCLIDGLQLSTGATFGKGNIRKLAGKNIKISARNLKKNKEAIIFFQPSLVERLNNLKGKKDSKVFARKLLRINNKGLFQLKIKG